MSCCLGHNCRHNTLFLHLHICMQACQFTSSRFWGEVSDSVGRRKILMMSALGTVVLHISCAFTPVLWPMFIGIAVEGVTAAGYSVGQVR